MGRPAVRDGDDEILARVGRSQAELSALGKERGVHREESGLAGLAELEQRDRHGGVQRADGPHDHPFRLA